MDINVLENRLEEIHAALLGTDSISGEFLKNTNDEYLYSAHNLLYYLTLRGMDLREVQPSLIALGISSLGTSAGYVLENVSRTLELLRLIRGEKTEIDFEKPSVGARRERRSFIACRHCLFRFFERQKGGHYSKKI